MLLFVYTLKVAFEKHNTANNREADEDGRLN